MKKLKIAVLFGGCSPEYSVSLQSAAAVLQNSFYTAYGGRRKGVQSIDILMNRIELDVRSCLNTLLFKIFKVLCENPELLSLIRRFNNPSSIS